MGESSCFGCWFWSDEWDFDHSRLSFHRQAHKRQQDNTCTTKKENTTATFCHLFLSQLLLRPPTCLHSQPPTKASAMSFASKNISLLALIALLLSGVVSSFRPIAPAVVRSPSVTSRTTTLFAKSGTKKKKIRDGTICVNRQARRNYEIIETMEAGIVLKGTEVKSIRDGKFIIRDSFVKPSFNGRSCTLMNSHIGKHTMAGPFFQHEEKRPRELLLHKSEARKIKLKTDQSGMTAVPLKAYFNKDNRVKLQIALCKGKNMRDKRADIKERDLKRETDRAIKSFRI